VCKNILKWIYLISEFHINWNIEKLLHPGEKPPTHKENGRI
jgi:hypothetical protein